MVVRGDDAPASAPDDWWRLEPATRAVLGGAIIDVLEHADRDTPLQVHARS
jgi:hypothetical protein